MKKYVGIILSLILVVFSFFTMSTQALVKEVAGAGEKTNQEISSLEELGEVVEYASKRKEAMNKGKNQVDSFEEEKAVNLTMVETGEMSIKANGVSLSMNRTLSIYFAEGASYYTSRGTIRAKNAKNQTNYYFDLQLYLNGERSLIKFKEFSYSRIVEQKDADKKEYMIISPSKKGIWIEAPIECTEIVTLVNDLNLDGLKTLKTYIQSALKTEDMLSKEGDLYSFEKDGADFVCDLSEAKNPCVTLTRKETDEKERYSEFVYAGMEFYNIGNTVVRDAIKAEYVCKDLETFNDLFITNE